jgi:hypothetical protein
MDLPEPEEAVMAELGRMLTAVALAAAIGGCGMLTGNGSPGPTVPEPITPAQKATADPTNPDSAIVEDFNARLDKYVKTQRALLEDSPVGEEATPAQIKAREDTLAAQLRTIRAGAKQGDIFTPEVAALFKRLLNPIVQGPQGRETKQALSEEDGEVAQVWLRVNASWPDSEPLTTVPPNMLAKLPQLPPDVEYRISNRRHLVLRDVDANIIIDFIYNAIR